LTLPLLRTPEMGAGTEIIFVEGHSRDDHVGANAAGEGGDPQRKIKILQQRPRKRRRRPRRVCGGDRDILMILDAT